MFVVLEIKNLNPAQGLSMSKDIRDWPQANLGVASNMFKHLDVL